MPDAPDPRQQPLPHLLMATIYERPRDYPGQYVVRLCRVMQGTGAIEPDPQCAIFATAEQARAYVRQSWPAMVLIQARGQDPDPCVLEVYC